MTFKKYNAEITITEEKSKNHILDLNNLFKLNDLAYLDSPEDKHAIKSVTHILLMDFTKAHAFNKLKACLDFLITKDGHKARISIIPINASDSVNFLQQLWFSSIQTFHHNKKGFYELWSNIISEDMAMTSNAVNEDNNHFNTEILFSTDIDLNKDIDQTSKEILIKYFSNLNDIKKFEYKMDHVIKNEEMLISNGYTYYIDNLSVDDFVSIQKVLSEFKLGNAISKILYKNLPDEDKLNLNNYIFYTNVLFNYLWDPEAMSTDIPTSEIKKILNKLSKEASFETKAVFNGIQLTVIFDPFKKEVQKISQILLFLNEILNLNIKVYLNPKLDISEMPIKQYYRYSLPKIHFSPDNISIQDVLPPLTFFPNLPHGNFNDHLISSSFKSPLINQVLC